MRTLSELFEANRKWSAERQAEDSTFFTRQSEGQAPRYLWIGCADSRVPASQIVGVEPGEMFVHRNIANVVAHSDLNCLSVLQYAIDVLGVAHVVVCGHYRCGGVYASLQGERRGLISNWLCHIGDVREKHRDELSAIEEDEARWDRLCELNVIEQVANVCRSSVARDAWGRGQELSVHGWMYDIKDGLLHDMNICVTDADEFVPLRREAVASTRSRG